MNWILFRPVRTALNQAMAAALLSVALVLPVCPWLDHASLVWPLLRSQSQLIQQTIAAEPLDAFLAAEQAGIAEILEVVDSWSVATIEHYLPTPEHLRWGADHAPPAWSELSFFGGGTSQPAARFSTVASGWIAHGRIAESPAQRESQ